MISLKQIFFLHVVNACLVPCSSVNLHDPDILFIINNVSPDTYFIYFYVHYYAISCVKGHISFLSRQTQYSTFPHGIIQYET